MGGSKLGASIAMIPYMVSLAFLPILIWSAGASVSGLNHGSVPESKLTQVLKQEGCGLNCQLEAAKNLLAVEQLYLANQTKKLLAPGASANTKKIYESFCAVGESDQACKTNYLNSIRVRIHELRSEIGHLENQVASLNVGYSRNFNPSADRKVRIFDTDSVELKANKKRIAVPSASESLADYQRIHGVSGLRNTFKTSELTTRAPNPKDFPKFVSVLKNANDPAAGFITIVKRNADGSPELDSEAYKMAQNDYQEMLQGFQSSGTLSKTRMVAGLSPNLAPATPASGSVASGNVQSASNTNSGNTRSSSESNVDHQNTASRFSVAVESIDEYENVRGKLVREIEKKAGTEASVQITQEVGATPAATEAENTAKLNQLVDTSVNVHMSDRYIVNSLESSREPVRMN